MVFSSEVVGDRQAVPVQTRMVGRYRIDQFVTGREFR